MVVQWKRFCYSLALVCFVSGNNFCHGSSHGPVEEVEEVVEGVKVTLKLNLGNIEIKHLEPTQGRTSQMSFDMHLTFAPNTELKQIQELETWHHRLREQVIIGVRATDIHDFLDPELKRFRKQIVYRINRMLKSPTVVDVLLANFTFSSQ